LELLKVIEVANQLGVSKVTIYKKMELYKKELKGDIQKVKGITFLNQEAFDLIKRSLIENGVIKDEHLTPELIESYQRKLKEKYSRMADLSLSVVNVKKDNLNDLDLVCEFLSNQINMKQQMLTQKDEQLKAYKEMIMKNKKRIEAMEGFIKSLQK
jgi:hypothetical protein